MKRILLILIFLNVRSLLFASLIKKVHYSEDKQIDDMKDLLNKAKNIVIESRIDKSYRLSRYKRRKDEAITWYAQISSPLRSPACISISYKATLQGDDNPSNYLVWYEWVIEAKEPGLAQLKLERYKNFQLEETQIIKVEVKA